MKISTDYQLILEKIHSHSSKWISLSTEEKCCYLDDAMERLLSHAHVWAQACAMAKGIAIGSSLEGQEWLTGPGVTMKQMRQLRNNLSKGSKEKLVSFFKIDEHFVAKVLPTNIYESILWNNMRAEVWVQKGKPVSCGKTRKKNFQVGKVCFILGAGNVSSISVLDALHKLFQEGAVCLVKLNPVNEYLYDVFQRIFHKLIQDGFLQFIRVDNETSAWLCENDLVDEIHITGSHHTHDTIVWGNADDPETKIRREKNQPKLNKKITSELGCVTPVIVVPGVWTDVQFEFQAKQIVSMVENNASFNCNAAKVLVLCKQWPQRDLFLKYLRKEFQQCKTRQAYYPGAKDRFQKFTNQYPLAEKIGEPKEKDLPWLFIPNLDPKKEELAFQTEAFCSVLGEVSLDAENPGDFMHHAAEFCNEKLWGTLSCNLIIHPETEKQYKKKLEETLGILRYGSIGVNCWAAISFALGGTTWGAYPGHTLQDIQSGIDVVHNNFFVDNPEKSIIRAAFSIWPKPVWFYDHENVKSVAQKMLKFDYSNRFIDFFQVILAAFKG